MKWLSKTGFGAALAVVSLGVSIGTARADVVSDGMASAEQNAQDQLTALQQGATNNLAGKSTCGAHAYGTLEAPYTNAAVVGSVNGEDISVGDGECASSTSQSYSMCVTVGTQYWVPGTGPWTTFATIGACQTVASAPARTALAPGTVQNLYPAQSQYLNSWHRTEAIVTDSTGNQQVAYSAEWYMPAA